MGAGCHLQDSDIICVSQTCVQCQLHDLGGEPVEGHARVKDVEALAEPRACLGLEVGLLDKGLQCVVSTPQACNILSSQLGKCHTCIQGACALRLEQTWDAAVLSTLIVPRRCAWMHNRVLAPGWLPGLGSKAPNVSAASATSCGNFLHSPGEARCFTGSWQSMQQVRQL